MAENIGLGEVLDVDDGQGSPVLSLGSFEVLQNVADRELRQLPQ